MESNVLYTMFYTKICTHTYIYIKDYVMDHKHFTWSC